MILITLVVAFTIVLAVTLTSCGIADKIQDAINGGEGGSDAQADPMKTAEQIEDLIGEKFLITFKLSASSGNETDVEYITTAQSAPYTMWSQGDSTVLLKKIGNLYYLYSKDGGTRYTSVDSYPTEVNPFRSIMAYMLINDGNIEYTSKSNITFLNRPCAKYVYDYSAATWGASVSVYEEWVIVNATGACLKHSWGGSASTIDGTSSGSAAFEATVFETGSSVDSYIAHETAKIDVKEWDTDIMEAIGLSEVNAPDAKFINASIDEDDYTLTYSAHYVIYGEITDSEEIVELIQAFFNSGANRIEYNPSVVCPTFDDEDIYFYDEEDPNYIGFSAATNSHGDYVQINASFYEDEGGWTIDIQVNDIA